MTGLFILLAVSVLSACSSSGLTSEGTDVSDQNWTIPDFTYTNQDGEAFGLSDLEGKVWLANFIFHELYNSLHTHVDEYVPTSAAAGR